LGSQIFCEKNIMFNFEKKILPKTSFYFLDEREVGLLERLVDNVNELTSEYLKMIDLDKKQLIGVLEQKIIKE